MKRKNIYNLSFINVFIIIPFFLFCMGAGDENMESKELEFISIGKGIITDNADYNKMDQPYLFYITSKESWSELKIIFSVYVFSEENSQCLLEEIDFETHNILVFTPGVMGATGYDIELLKIEIDNTLTFSITHIFPEKELASRGSLTHPFHMVLIEKIDFPEEIVFYMNDKLTSFEIIKK